MDAFSSSLWIANMDIDNSNNNKSEGNTYIQGKSYAGDHIKAQEKQWMDRTENQDHRYHRQDSLSKVGAKRLKKKTGRSGYAWEVLLSSNFNKMGIVIMKSGK